MRRKDWQSPILWRTRNRRRIWIFHEQMNVMAVTVTAVAVTVTTTTKRRSSSSGTQALWWGFVWGPLPIVVFLLRGGEHDHDHDAVATPTTPPQNAMATCVPTMAPGVPPEGSLLQSVLPDFTVEATAKPGAPQAKACEWMLEDGVLKVGGRNHWRIRQRFAPATLHFSTNGDNWSNDKDWVHHDTHECFWFSHDWFKSTSSNQFDDFVGIQREHANPCETVLSPASIEFAHGKERDCHHLWVWGNDLTGAVPPEVFFLTSLRSFSLRENPDLSGHIPTD